MMDINEHTKRFGSLRDRLEEKLFPQIYYAHSIQDLMDNYYKLNSDGRKVHALKPTRKLWLYRCFNGMSIVIFPNLRVEDEVVVPEVGRFFHFYDSSGSFVGGIEKTFKLTKDETIHEGSDVREGQRIYLPNFTFNPKSTPYLKLLSYKDIFTSEAAKEPSFSLADLCFNPV
jgi:hypothetical protein